MKKNQEKMKEMNRNDFYSGMLLMFVISVAVNMFIGLANVVVSFWDLPVYLALVLEGVFYLCILAFVMVSNFRSPIPLTYFVIAFLFAFFPKNYFYLYSIDELSKLTEISTVEAALKYFFWFLLGLTVFVKHVHTIRAAKKADSLGQQPK